MMRNTSHRQKTSDLLTLRNLSPELSRAIQEEARKKGLSLNKTVIGLLEEKIGLSHKKEKSRYHDLDSLAGCWTEKEAQKFDQTLFAQRSIDPELWK